MPSLRTTGISVATALWTSAITYAAPPTTTTTPSMSSYFNASGNSSLPAPTCSVAKGCKDGIVIKMWLPNDNLSTSDIIARATVYFFAMVFLFLGVSIIADRFMAAIEVITSKEKEVTVRKPDGTTTVVCVRIWNETVSNLTLMALGSSTPEILLSIIEICGNGFEAGDLGPGTIVGSAAFNLFIIIGICVYCIPDGEVRRIKHLRVFFITATWSVFAYLWMYLIIAVISYGEVEVWEGIVTFMFFPITVVTAYFADRKIFIQKLMSKRYRQGRRKTIVVTEDAHFSTELEGKNGKLSSVDDLEFRGTGSGTMVELPGGQLVSRDSPEALERQEFESHRKEFISILRETRAKHPNAPMKELEEMAELEAMNRGPKSRAFYRIQATRKLTGGGKVIKKSKLERHNSQDDLAPGMGDVGVDALAGTTRIFFSPGHYTVMENVGTFYAAVVREGGDPSLTVRVDYESEDGTADAGTDYLAVRGTLTFLPGESRVQIAVTIIDDDVFEEDEHFYLKLSNIRVGDDDSVNASQTNDKGAPLALLDNPSMATVMILDDDHCGVFQFEKDQEVVSESVGEYELKVQRASGARGMVRLKYTTSDGTATGKDFVRCQGDILFENNQTEAFIPIKVIDSEEYEKDATFYVTLQEPRPIRINAAGQEVEIIPVDAINKDNTTGDYEDQPRRLESQMSEEERISELGRPRLGDICKTAIHISESIEFKSTVDKLVKKTKISLVIGTSSWREQFTDAISVSAGNDEESGERLPSCMDYVMHFLTVFWKVIFAFVPPTEYLGGWACFTTSIIGIAMLTALIGDIASGFGCTLGLKDAVTAISFVAIGTSVPDTLASKVAAIGDQYADSSIGNVTGSNAVNVFLGIGLAWTIAAVKHAIYGTKFVVLPGSLAFSVTIYCIFAFAAIAMLMLRRWHPSCGGELGGRFRLATTTFFFSLWIMYILLSSLENYCHIPGF